MSGTLKVDSKGQAISVVGVNASGLDLELAGGARAATFEGAASTLSGRR